MVVVTVVPVISTANAGSDNSILLIAHSAASVFCHAAKSRTRCFLLQVRNASMETNCAGKQREGMLKTETNMYMHTRRHAR